MRPRARVSKNVQMIKREKEYGLWRACRPDTRELFTLLSRLFEERLESDSCFESQRRTSFHDFSIGRGPGSFIRMSINVANTKIGVEAIKGDSGPRVWNR